MKPRNAPDRRRRVSSSAGTDDGARPAPVDLRRLKLYSARRRRHLAAAESVGGTPAPGATFREWLDALPDQLGARRLRAAADAVIAARRACRPVAMAMGGHVVKVGCGPVVIDLMRRGLVTAVAVHGATAIHDVELAMLGATSEDVGENLRTGRFGMVRETMSFFARAVRYARRRRIGYGRAVGQLILDRRLPHARLSMLAAAAELGLPATIHAAIGTDTVHMFAGIDGAALGEATLLDFRLACGVVRAMGAERRGGPCGVWFNIGSAVLLPEVFLKTVAVARNLGARLDDLTTVNMDMIRHYRPSQNVVGRPVAPGHGLDLCGHHEIMLPLLRQAIVEQAGGIGA